MFLRWTWWKTKLYKNFKVFKFWRKGLEGKGNNHLIKKLCSMGSKCLVWSASHMCKKKYCQKTCLVIRWNSFLKFMGIFAFLAINKNIHTQLCMNVKLTTATSINLNWTNQFFSLKFVQVNVICKKQPHKNPWVVFFFFFIKI
jgi:hypothetical protein